MFRKQQCRLKSTTTNGCQNFGQQEQLKSSIMFPMQSEKSPDSGFFTCDPTKKCIMPSSRERHKGIIGRGHYLRLPVHRSSDLPIHRSTYRATDLAIYRSNDLHIHRFSDLPIHRSGDLPIHHSRDPLIYRSTDLQIHQSTGPSIYRSSDPVIYQSIDRTI